MNFDLSTKATLNSWLALSSNFMMMDVGLYTGQGGKELITASNFESST